MKRKFPVSNEDLFSFLRTAFWICFPILIANTVVFVSLATTDHFLIADHERWKQKDEPRTEELWWWKKHQEIAKTPLESARLSSLDDEKKSLNQN